MVCQNDGNLKLEFHSLGRSAGTFVERFPGRWLPACKHAGWGICVFPKGRGAGVSLLIAPLWLVQEGRIEQVTGTGIECQVQLTSGVRMESSITVIKVVTLFLFFLSSEEKKIMPHNSVPALFTLHLFFVL